MWHSSDQKEGTPKEDYRNNKLAELFLYISLLAAGLMTVTNSSALSWQFIDSKTGSVVDSFTVRRTQV